MPRHATRKHERLRLRAALGQAALDEEHIDTFLHAPMIASWLVSKANEFGYGRSNRKTSSV
jgi:hypothetical protein